MRSSDPGEIDLRKLDKIIEIAERWMEKEPNYEAARLALTAYTLRRILEKEGGGLS